MFKISSEVAPNFLFTNCYFFVPQTILYFLMKGGGRLLYFWSETQYAENFMQVWMKVFSWFLLRAKCLDLKRKYYTLYIFYNWISVHNKPRNLFPAHLNVVCVRDLSRLHPELRPFIAWSCNSHTHVFTIEMERVIRRWC